MTSDTVAEPNTEPDPDGSRRPSTSLLQPPLSIPEGGWLRAASRASSDRSAPYVCTYYQTDDEGWSPSVFHNTYASFEDAFERKRVYSSEQDDSLVHDGMVALCEETCRLWLVSKRGADGTVEYWRLPPSEKKSLDAARGKEIDTL